MTYPSTPGHHGETTSRKAAQSMREASQTDRQACLAAYRRHGAMTADECAQRLGWADVYRARRRITELALGALEDSGEERATASGRAARVLRIPRHPPAQATLCDITPMRGY